MPESQYSISAVISVGESNSSFIAWTSATPINSTAMLVNADFSYNTIVVSLNQTTTITGGVITFQGSLDGANWFNVEGASPINGAAVGPTFNLAVGYSVFTFNLTAIPYFQILLSTAITGTGTVTIGYSADSFVNTFFPIGSGSSGNASVGPNGSPIPGDSTLIGSEDASGNLQPASASNPVPVTTVTASATNAPTVVSIGLTSTSVLASNTARKGLNLCNISFGTVSISFGSAAAVLFSGVTLGPGGTFWMDATDFTTGAVHAIASQSNTEIAVQEFQ